MKGTRRGIAGSLRGGVEGGQGVVGGAKPQGNGIGGGGDKAE